MTAIPDTLVGIEANITKIPDENPDGDYQSHLSRIGRNPKEPSPDDEKAPPSNEKAPSFTYVPEVKVMTCQDKPGKRAEKSAAGRLLDFMLRITKMPDENPGGDSRKRRELDMTITLDERASKDHRGNERKERVLTIRVNGRRFTSLLQKVASGKRKSRKKKSSLAMDLDNGEISIILD